MAKPITRKEIRALETLSYEEARDRLQTGQLVFCSGNYWFSGAIQRLTRSTWSHVAIVYKDEELRRVMVLEAEPFVGIRLIPLSKYLKDYQGKRRPYKGRIVVADIENPPEKHELNKAISFGLDELTRPYDNWEIIRIMLRILFRKGRKERNRSYICSELVRDCYAKAGLKFQLQDTYVSPDTIWSDARVVLKFRIL
jgi:hypothetical protein